MLGKGHEDREVSATSCDDVPWEDAPPLGRVSRDMEDIFGPAAKAELDQDKPRTADLVVSISPHPRRWLRPSGLTMPLMALGVGSLAACAGLWALLATLDQQESEKPQVAAMTQPAAKPSPRPQPVAVAAIAPPAPAAQLQPAPAVKSIAPDKQLRKAPSKVEPARLASTSIETCSRMKRAARALCMQPHVTQVDNEMRRAYVRAVSRGVKGSTLRSFRNRWDNVMLRRTSDPFYVTDSLPDMARRLDDKRPSRS